MPLRCVIVDDSPDFLGAASVLLEQQGISVVGLASTAAQAYSACRELHPDVVLLDVDLGNETGFDVARGLTQQAGPAGPRVILISAHAPDEFEDMITGIPAVTFMPKAGLSGAAILGIASRPASDGHQRDSR
jgi:DNA-binding response OmpR family regulator